MNLLVSRLIDFSRKNLELKEDDVCYVSNKVFELLNVENGELVDNDIIDVSLDSILSDLYKKICLTKHINITTFNDLVDKLMDILTPYPSVVMEQFTKNLNINYLTAFDYFISLLKSNNHINNIPSYNDRWTSSNEKYAFSYVLNDSTVNNGFGLNTRYIKIQDEDILYKFTFTRSQNIVNQILFEVKTDDIKKRYLNELHFVKRFPNMFLLDDNNHIIGGENSLMFFQHESFNELTNKFFVNTKISVLDSKFFTLKVVSKDENELIETLLYIDNIWKILGNNNYSVSCFTSNINEYTAYIILLDKKLDCDHLFVRKIEDISLVLLGVISLNGQTKKEISKLANVLSNHTFDLDWYLSANDDLVEYEEFIKNLIEQNKDCEDKVEAISIIQNAISEKLEDIINTLVVYNKNDKDNIDNFLSLLK